MVQKLKNEIYEFKLLLKNVPGFITAAFVLAVFSMNLLANKSIALPFEWLALDCGIIVSWFAFLAMDVITKHFGPKAATQISIFATALSLMFSLFFFICSVIPGVWSQAGEQDTVINTALDRTFGGTWYVIAGSTLAFVTSAAINNFTNRAVNALFRKRSDGAAAFLVSSYVSTAIGQFSDNMIFSLAVSRVFFGWSLIQCLTCSLTGMLAELLFEVVFSYGGFKISRRWSKEQIGREYLDYRCAKINEEGKR
ncbi:MAG: VUT family protein [Eubacteriales bacterium]